MPLREGSAQFSIVRKLYYYNAKSQTMPDSLMPESRSVDEISIIDVLNTLWDGRVMIILGIVLGLLVGTGRFLIFRNDIQASMSVIPRPVAENNQYNGMNRYFSDAYSEETLEPGVGRPVAGLSFLKSVPKIEDQLLVKRFIDSLRDGSILTEAARKTGVVEAPTGARESAQAEIDEFISSIRYKEPLPPEIRNRNYLDSFWTISFNTESGRGKATAFVTEIVQRATQRVRTDLLEEAERAISSAKAEQGFAVTDLENQLNRTISYAVQMNAHRIKHLNEQAAIARTLNIAKNELKVQSFGGSPGVVSISEELPDYLRGYEALEKEAQLLKTRGDDPAYVVRAISIRNDISRLKQDQSVARAEQALRSSPLTSDAFQAIVYNPGMLTLARSVSLTSSLLLPTLLGGLAGMLIVFGRGFLAQRKIV